MALCDSLQSMFSGTGISVAIRLSTQRYILWQLPLKIIVFKMIDFLTDTDFRYSEKNKEWQINITTLSFKNKCFQRH
jgi:hypothetical protein